MATGPSNTHTHARTYTRKHTRTRTQAHMRAHEESQHAHELCEYSKALNAWYCDGNQKYKHTRPGKKQKSILLSITRRRQSTTPTIPQTTYKNKQAKNECVCADVRSFGLDFGIDLVPIAGVNFGRSWNRNSLNEEGSEPHEITTNKFEISEYPQHPVPDHRDTP